MPSAAGVPEPTTEPRRSSRPLRALILCLLAAHLAWCAYGTAGLIIHRARFIAWWRHADQRTREDHLYGRSDADLMRLCLQKIPAGDRVLVRTDTEPWLLNYYLYPRQLFQETASPDVNNYLAPPSKRQMSIPRRQDIPVDWIVEDFLFPPEARQTLLRVVPVQGVP